MRSSMPVTEPYRRSLAPAPPACGARTAATACAAIPQRTDRAVHARPSRCVRWRLDRDNGLHVAQTVHGRAFWGKVRAADDTFEIAHTVSLVSRAISAPGFQSSPEQETDGSPWTASPPVAIVDALRASQAIGRSPVANGQAQLRHTTLTVGASLSCGAPRA